MGYFDRFSQGIYADKSKWQKIWHFIWKEDSLESWLINIALAYVVIKFLIYPGLGFLLATSHPIVAVVSSSMHHNANLDTYWGYAGQWYEEKGITKESFRTFPMHNGFNKGDIMVLVGRDPNKIKVGDVIVFANPVRPEPIIHRVVATHESFFQTKGDHNTDSLPFEEQILSQMIYGKAVFRIPLLGYVKISAVNLLNLVRGGA